MPDAGEYFRAFHQDVTMQFRVIPDHERLCEIALGSPVRYTSACWRCPLFAELFRDAPRLATILCMVVALFLYALSTASAVTDGMYHLQPYQAGASAIASVVQCTSASAAGCLDKGEGEPSDARPHCCEVCPECPVDIADAFHWISFASAMFEDQPMRSPASRMHMALERPPQH